MSEKPTFLVSPGGGSREAKDGGYIFPLHLDAAFVSKFYAYWREPGIQFALVPLLDGAAQPPVPPVPPSSPEPKPPRQRGAAERLHASGILSYPLFWRYLGFRTDGEPVGSSMDAHDSIKRRYSLASLSLLTDAQADELNREWLKWKRGQGEAK